MPSVKTAAVVLTAALLPTAVLAYPCTPSHIQITDHLLQTHASTLSLDDGGLSTSCGFSQQCCIPKCTVYVGDFYGCNGSVDFSATCQQNYDNPQGTQDVGGCSDVQVTFLRDPDGNPSIDVYYKPNRSYDRYNFFDCLAPNGPTPPQCGTSGGGCVR